MEHTDVLTDDAISIVDSEISNTSTEEFEHEPFETFQSKVFEFCKKEWPQLAGDTFEITRMEGGSYNRVVCIKVDTHKKRSNWFQRLVQKFYSSRARETQIREYVLRIPRYEHAWVEHEVELLTYLANTKIPAPKNKTSSFVTDNTLGCRYTLQPRLPGKSVQEVYINLNNQQRTTFAHDLGTALKEMLNLRMPCPGTLDPDHPTQILNLQCPPRNALQPTSNETPTAAKPQDVYTFLLSQFSRQRAYDLKHNRQYTNPWKTFTAIVTSLHDSGFLIDIPYTLTHMDFEARNMLVNIIDERKASLSGIIDWDESVFAPAFTNCRPPSWLWDFEDSDSDEEEKIVKPHGLVEPVDPELKSIKDTFDDAAGREYCRYAYAYEYRIARDICRLAITGVHCSGDYEVAERILEEWNSKVDGEGVGGIFDFDDE
jgi:aminoglycoside phosphotransferase (APT) family kinase protein